MEVELKVKVHDIQKIKGKLESIGARFEKPVKQEDSYFKPMREKEGPGDWILRIRDGGKKKSLTMKIFTDVRGAWVEHETGITDSSQVRKIIDALGFPNVFTFHKTRTKGYLEGIEICIDDVKELGKFAEFALDSDNGDDAKKEITEFIKKLGISEKDIEHRGYGEIYEESVHGKKFHGMR